MWISDLAVFCNDFGLSSFEFLERQFLRTRLSGFLIFRFEVFQIFTFRNWVRDVYVCVRDFVSVMCMFLTDSWFQLAAPGIAGRSRGIARRSRHPGI